MKNFLALIALLAFVVSFTPSLAQLTPVGNGSNMEAGQTIVSVPSPVGTATVFPANAYVSSFNTNTRSSTDPCFYNGTAQTFGTSSAQTSNATSLWSWYPVFFAFPILCINSGTGGWVGSYSLVPPNASNGGPGYVIAFMIPVTGPDTFTVKASAGVLYGGRSQNGLSSTLTCFDNASAASGTIVWVPINGGGSTYGGAMTRVGIVFHNGLTCQDTFSGLHTQGAGFLYYR
jgi:hypothetical protein